MEHTRQTDPGLLRVTVADKIDHARAILADYYQMGSKVWERFNAPQEDQIWYYTAAVDAYQRVRFSGFLMDELRALVEQIKRPAKPYV